LGLGLQARGARVIQSIQVVAAAGAGDGHA